MIIGHAVNSQVNIHVDGHVDGYVEIHDVDGHMSMDYSFILSTIFHNNIKLSQDVWHGSCCECGIL